MTNDTLWECVCVCGNMVQFYGRRLRNPIEHSCGCIPRKPPGNKSHGESHNRSPEYRIWCGIKVRTSNQNRRDSKNYVGRGITMFPGWRNSYEEFLAYVGRRPSAAHSIGRKDNDKGYEPGNVQWETLEQQANNCRTNKVVTENGKTMTIAQWSRHLGVPAGRLYSRAEKNQSLTESRNIKTLHPIRSRT